MALFSRRHYLFLAQVALHARREIARASESPIAREAGDCVINSLAQALEDENPNGFDKDLFLLHAFGLKELSDVDG